ncbi:MAG: M18 family aminopeptidase [Spongiibacteraceae bacterium]
MARTPNLIDDLLAFLKHSPTPFHATRNAAGRLAQAGFEQLHEADAWALQPGGRYYVLRNDSSVLAFVLGKDSPVENGMQLAGAHTDSPCLKIKPNPELRRGNCWQLGVEVYGGALLNPWFDRDLSLAGRVTYVDNKGILRSTLVDFREPIATIPSLAIHLDRDVNNNRSINPQQHLPLVLMSAAVDSEFSFRELLLQQIHTEQPSLKIKSVLDYEINCYDTQAPAVVGLQRDFIASARLDNLLSCFVALRALLSADGSRSCGIVLTDHEEVGSSSTSGAQGTLMNAVLQRVAGSHENYVRMIDRSAFISCDNAHGLHPNYTDRHDGNHGPQLNGGPVIKVNANQRYATNSETSALFRHLCQQEDVPVQNFVVRSDMACGSTIGPITATEIGIKTVDIGLPQWGMHSIRELAGSRDCEYLFRVLKRFFHA